MFHSELCDECGDCLVFCPYNHYEQERARQEIAQLKAGGSPPIVGSCITCGACNQVCPSQANPFDLINDRQEETGALGVPAEALDRFAKLLELATHVEKGEPGKPVVNLCIVGAMVREQLKRAAFRGPDRR